MLGNKNFLYEKTRQIVAILATANVNTATQQVTVTFSNESGVVFDEMTKTFDIANFDRHGDILAQGYATIKANGYQSTLDNKGKVSGGWINLQSQKKVDEFFGRTSVV
ncbi:MAG: hypothetical protein RSB09_03350 [Clostridia bacterium]